MPTEPWLVALEDGSQSKQVEDMDAAVRLASSLAKAATAPAFAVPCGERGDRTPLCFTFADGATRRTVLAWSEVPESLRRLAGA